MDVSVVWVGCTQWTLSFLDDEHGFGLVRIPPMPVGGLTEAQSEDGNRLLCAAREVLEVKSGFIKDRGILKTVENVSCIG